MFPVVVQTLAVRFTKDLAAFPSSLFSFVFPQSCLACRCVLPDGAHHLCPECRSTLSCVRVHDSIYRNTVEALTLDGVIDDLVVPYYFEKDGPLQQVIHLLKYSGMTSAGTLLGTAIGAQLRTEARDLHPAVIIPVPLHRVKQRERGYNQAEMIARGIARDLGGTVSTSILRRVVHTPSQTALDRKERARNVAGAFAIRKGSAGTLEGKTVLLVDDVITTGATLRSCAGALRPTGATSIIACAAALAR